MEVADRWDTDEKIDAAYDYFVSLVSNFVEPYAHAVGILYDGSARFPYVNVGEHLLPAVIIASACDYAPSESVIPMTVSQLRAALDRLLPAEYHPGLVHSNLASWREILADCQDEECQIIAVFLREACCPLPTTVDEDFRHKMIAREIEKANAEG